MSLVAAIITLADKYQIFAIGFCLSEIINSLIQDILMRMVDS